MGFYWQAIMEEFKDPRTVLIVDDDADIRQIIGASVSAMGYLVSQAINGDEALNKYHEFEPDVIVLDITMPGIHDGLKVCEIIKSEEKGRLIPIIMLTARDRLDDKVSGLSCGADDYLTKPFHYQELQARVNALMRVRELNLELLDKNKELLEMQKTIIEQERALVAMELAGTAAHELGQPLAAIVLNCHLLKLSLEKSGNPINYIDAIQVEVARMTSILDKLKKINPLSKKTYHGDCSIYAIDKK